MLSKILISFFACAVLALGWLAPAERSISIPVPTEYRANSGVGSNLAVLSSEVAIKTGNRVGFLAQYLGEHHYRSAVEMVVAMRTGSLGAADLFGAPLQELDPLFAESAAPFQALTLAEAEKHHVRLRPAYNAAFERMGLRLLYVTPWPPTGIWSNSEIRNANELQGLSIRTYDTSSKAVFTSMGARAEHLTYPEMTLRLENGTLDAALTSGDGGMGRQLWKHLHVYNDIKYAVPVSFTVIRETLFKNLTSKQQAAIVAATQEIDQRQWTLLRDRIAANEARMREQGVTISMAATESMAQAFNSRRTVQMDP